MEQSVIDDSDFQKKASVFLQQSKSAAKFSLEDVANEILRLSEIEVPLDKGTLQNSGNVQDVEDGYIIGYHTPYAARLHEHPEYHFQRGRKGKYLEDPIRNNQEALGIKFGRKFGGIIQTQ